MGPPAAKSVLPPFHSTLSSAFESCMDPNLGATWIAIYLIVGPGWALQSGPGMDLHLGHWPFMDLKLEPARSDLRLDPP